MTKKILILIGLLIIVIGFWLFSREFLKESLMKRQYHNTMMKQEPVSDAQMDSDIDSSLLFDSELELKSIDNEFN